MTRAPQRMRPGIGPPERAARRPKRTAPSDTYARIYAAVRRIPRGRVATYGQIASIALLPGHARQVGYAMHALPGASLVPWHRVVNASGGISLRASEWGGLQRALLEAEGVRFGRDGRLSLERFGWKLRGTARTTLPHSRHPSRRRK